MKKAVSSAGSFLLHSIPFALMLLVCVTCASDSNPADGNPTGGTNHVSFALEGAFTDIPILAGQNTNVVVTLQVPPSLGMIDSITVDVGETLKGLTFTPTITTSNFRGMLSLITGMDTTAQATIRIGKDILTVCQQGSLFGPYSVSTSYINNPPPSLLPVDSSTIRIFNEGPIVICMDIISPIAGSFSLDQVEADVFSAPCDDIADFAGIWAGVYQCSDNCTDIPFGDSVHITVTQDGSTASYVDGIGDTYSGKVCGNLFRFERTSSGEIERGSMTLDDDTHAIKRSTWRDRFSPFCAGDCVDSLVRVGAL